MPPNSILIARLRNVAIVLTVAALSAVASLAVLLVFFALPQADDFVLAAAGREEGGVQYAIGVYREWSGRWSGHAIIAGVHAAVDPSRYYPLVIAASLAIYLAGVYLLVRTVLGAELSTRAAVALTIVFFSLLWSGRPGLAETMYWFSGSVPYQTSVALGIMLIAGLSRRIGPDVSSMGVALRALGWSLLALVVTGMLELTGAAICLILGVGAVVATASRDRERALWISVFVVAVVGFAIVLLAPGNAVRSTEFPRARNLATLVRFFGGDVAKYGVDWVFDPKLLAATLVFVLNPTIAKLHPRWLLRTGIPWKLIVPVVWLTILAAGFAGPRWATGRWIPNRVIDVNYTLFWIGWFITAFVWTRGLRETIAMRARAACLIEVAALIALVFSVVLSGNVPIAASDLRHRIPAWHAALEERFRQAREAESDSRLVVTPIPTQPKLLHVLDLNRGGHHWANRGFAKYFGLKSVSMKPGPLGRRLLRMLQEAESREVR